MELGITVARLRDWIELATALQRELGQPNPDEEVVNKLLRDQVQLQADLTQVKEAAADPEARELVQTILEVDRASMKRAQGLRAQFLAMLAEARSRHEVVTGYRRAMGNLSRQSGAFVDHCV